MSTTQEDFKVACAKHGLDPSQQLFSLWNSGRDYARAALAAPVQAAVVPQPWKWLVSWGMGDEEICQTEALAKRQKRLLDENGWLNVVIEPIYRAAAPAAPSQAQAMPVESLIGLSVSVDVSTNDNDAAHRYFGKVDAVQECSDEKNGIILLVQEPKPNFTPQAQQVAEAVPNRPSDDKLWDQTLRERDRYHEVADRLAGAIAEYFGADIGEHSSANCPWDEAERVIEEAEPYQPTAQAAPASQVLHIPLPALRNIGAKCLSEGDCMAVGIPFEGYEKGIYDAVEAIRALAHKPASGEA